MPAQPIGIGHTQMLFDRQYRLHASMRARGASASAIARLPKMPRFAKTFDLQPVLATYRDAARTDLQELAKKGIRKRHASKALALHAAIKRQTLERDVDRVSGPLHPQVTARVKAIAGVVAEAAGADAAQLLAWRTPRRWTHVKHMAIYLASVLTDVAVMRLGDIFQYSDHTSARYGIQKAKYTLRMAYPSALELHEKALAAIKARWPEYDA